MTWHAFHFCLIPGSLHICSYRFIDDSLLIFCFKQICRAQVHSSVIVYRYLFSINNVTNNTIHKECADNAFSRSQKQKNSIERKFLLKRYFAEKIPLKVMFLQSLCNVSESETCRKKMYKSTKKLVDLSKIVFI